MVVAPGVVRRERPTLLVLRLQADELLVAGIGQRVDGAVEPELRERFGFALARAEAGTPEQALGLCDTKRPLVNGDTGQRSNPPAGS